MTSVPIAEDADTTNPAALGQDSTQPRPLMRDRYHEQLDEVDLRLAELGDSVIQALTSSVEALDALDVTRAKALIEGDGQIDATRHEIDEQAFHLLATQQPTASDLRLLTAVSSVTGELERIADHCAGIAKLTLTMAGEPRGEPNPAIEKMAEITTDLLRGALGAFRGRDAEAAGIIWSRDDEVDELYQEFFRHQIEEMVNHRKRVRRGTYMLWVAHNIERVADRVTNIAEAVAFVTTGDVAAWREQIEAESVPPSF
jgi:phosphate transport system protein